MDTQQQQWLSPGQAARMAHLSTEWLRQLADSGRVVAQRTALGRLYQQESIERLCRERQQCATVAL